MFVFTNANKSIPCCCCCFGFVVVVVLISSDLLLSHPNITVLGLTGRKTPSYLLTVTVLV